MVTFSVDDVRPEVGWIEQIVYGGETPDAIVRARSSEELRVISHGSTHALLGAVHRAFAEHRPLVLSPDAIWLTIAQGVAQHVRLNAERLRPQLVRHSGKKEIKVTVGAVPSDAAGWASLIPAFRGALAGEVGDGRARLFECSFSTSTEVDLIASQVVLMDAYAPFFDYWAVCVCGIPTITLTGTVDDWRAIRQRIDVIAELDLEHWCRSLRPILDELVAAADGRANRAFWKRICNPRDAYGGEVITGWIARLYPYLIGGSEAAHPNPLLSLPIDEPKHVSANTVPIGIKTNDVLAGACSVRINVAGDAFTSAVALEAGVTLVVQDDDGQLMPLSDWCVRPARATIVELAERIRAEHHAEPPTERLREGSAEMMAFYQAIGSATLFDGKWTIRAAPERTPVPLMLSSYAETHRTIDGADGRFLVHIEATSQSYWVVGYPDRLDLDIVGTTFVDVLNALINTSEPPAVQRPFGKGRRPDGGGDDASPDDFLDEEPTNRF